MKIVGDLHRQQGSAPVLSAMTNKAWTFCEYDLAGWEPLADHDKPELPYRPGLHLSIRRHVPIPPFGRYYSSTKPARHKNSLEERCYTKLSDWALRYPPSKSPPHPDPSVCDLEVLDAIACRDGRGAQLVRCRLGSDKDPDSIYVAKIYDPFYYSQCSGGPYDVTLKADNDYSREAASYDTLHDAKADTKKGGQLVPTYYGSWTFNLPVPEILRSSSGVPSTTRPVRMILLAWVPDSVSLDVFTENEAATKNISIAIRLEVAAKAMETICRIEAHGVQHNDFAARNVIVSPASPDAWTMDNPPSVLIIDFNVAHIPTLPCFTGKWYTKPLLPQNPRYRWDFDGPNYFGRWWFPMPYRQGTIYINGWLRTRWREEEPGFCNPSPDLKEIYDDETSVVYLPWEPDSPVHTSELDRAYHQDE